jgi:hypothetical protein
MNTNLSLINTDPMNPAANGGPAAAALPLPLPRRTRNRPRSNIALLPHGVREMVNQALREGMIYEEIICRVGILVGQDHGVNRSNLSRWYKTDYQDWLREKNRLEYTIAQGDAVLARLARLKAETGADLPDLTAALLASLLQSTLQDFQPDTFKAWLAQNPQDLFRLLTSLNAHIAVRSQHTLAEIARVRCHIEVAEKAETAAQAAAEAEVPAQRLYDSEMFRNSTGTPLEQLMANLKARASAQKPKKRRHTSAKQPQIHPANSSSVAPDCS